MLRLVPHPELHALFETVGYALGFAVYKQQRHRSGDVLDSQQRWSVIAAAVVGALAGSRLLGVLEQTPRTHVCVSQLMLWTEVAKR